MADDEILSRFDALARSRAGDPLVVSPRRRWSVGEVDDLARELELAVRGACCVPGALVGLAVPNGPGFLAAFLALRRAGCAVVLFDWRTPDEEIERVAQALGVSNVVTSTAPWPRVTDDVAVREVSGRGHAPAMLDPEVAVVKLTSGSTGTPRGILKTAAQLAADDDGLARSMGLETDERILAAIPMSHSYGLDSVFLPAVRRGSVLVVPDGASPFDTIAATRDCAVTFMPTVPAYVRVLLKMEVPPPLPETTRLVITAGAPLDPATAARFRAVYGLPIHVFYGASEVGGITYDRSGTAGERGTLGTPVEGVTVTLAAVDDARDEGHGVVTVHSPAAALGYYPDPSDDLAAGRFRTSDLGRLEDGELRLLGRVDDLINVRGKKVNPREVEEVLAAMAGVEESVVVGGPSGDGSASVVRAVVACSPGAVTVEGLMRWCRGRLAPHKVPRSVVLVRELPRNPRGKVDRLAVQELVPGPPGDP